MDGLVYASTAEGTQQVCRGDGPSGTGRTSGPSLKDRKEVSDECEVKTLREGLEVGLKLGTTKVTETKTVK